MRARFMRIHRNALVARRAVRALESTTTPKKGEGWAVRLAASTSCWRCRAGNSGVCGRRWGQRLGLNGDSARIKSRFNS